MTKRKDLPEAATQPPPILTPAEDARRAGERVEREDRRVERGIPSDPADPNDPLRQPGELSSPAEGGGTGEDTDRR